MKIIDINKAEELIKHSVEAKWSKKHSIFFAISVILESISNIFFIKLLLIMSPDGINGIETVREVFSVLISSYAWNAILHTVSIFLLIRSLSGISNITMRKNALKSLDGYNFYDGIADEVNGKKRYMSLHISTQDENGEPLSLNTKVFYDKYGRSGPSPYDYYKNRVLIGYNKITDICVIINIFKENETLEECIERALR